MCKNQIAMDAQISHACTENVTGYVKTVLNPQ